MSRKYSIGTPITLSVTAIVSSIVIVVSWNVIFASYYFLATETQKEELGVGYWLMNGGGNGFMAIIIAALSLLMASNIKRTILVRRQDTFIDSVTHELKSPLASLRLSLDTMKMRELTPAQRKRFEGMMRADVDRLQAFIEHILEAGRLEHHGRELKITPTDLPAMVDRCVDRLASRHRIDRAAFHVEMKLEHPEEERLVDPVYLDMILVNLLDNAIKYAAPPYEVELTISESDDEEALVVEVKDNGIGIHPKEIKRIFDRFYRVERGDHPQAKGTGLGLYLVQSIVKRLGGKVEVRSEGEGKGSTFTVTLPHPEDEP